MVVKGASTPGHRQRQALATKHQVTEAARQLFAAQGYVSTTITAISEAADIPVPTIYSAFGSKAKILEAIAREAVGSLDVDRTHDAALALDDPVAGLRMVVGLQRRQYEAMFDVISVYQEAARVDPELAAGLSSIQRNRERGFRRHIEAIGAVLKPGLTIAEGVDIYLALVLPEIYRTLVIERKWSPDRYEEWLAAQFISELLGP